MRRGEALIARKAPRRHPRTAARWLLRYVGEHPAAMIAPGERRSGATDRGPTSCVPLPLTQQVAEKLSKKLRTVPSGLMVMWNSSVTM